MAVLLAARFLKNELLLDADDCVLVRVADGAVIDGDEEAWERQIGDVLRDGDEVEFVPRGS